MMSGITGGATWGNLTGTITAQTDLVAYIAAHSGSAAGLFNDRGNFDASAVPSFPTSGGSGPGGSVMRGDTWTISAVANSGSSPLLGYAIGTTLRATQDLPGGDYWTIGQVGLNYTPASSATTVNGHALSGNITLTASDVSAVPTSRTVNSKALSSNIALSAADVGAPSGSGTCSGTNTGDQTLPTLSSLGGARAFTASNTIWVDAANGNDSTGTVGRSDLPYQTLLAAYTAVNALSGGSSAYKINLGVGAYTLTLTGIVVTASVGIRLNVDGAGESLTTLSVSTSGNDEGGNAPHVYLNQKGVTSALTSIGCTASGGHSGNFVVTGGNLSSITSATDDGLDFAGMYTRVKFTNNSSYYVQTGTSEFRGCDFTIPAAYVGSNPTDGGGNYYGPFINQVQIAVNTIGTIANDKTFTGQVELTGQSPTTVKSAIIPANLKSVNHYTRELFAGTQVFSANGATAILTLPKEGLMGGYMGAVSSGAAVNYIFGGTAFQGNTESPVIYMGQSWSLHLRALLACPTNTQIYTCLGAYGATGIPSTGNAVGFEIYDNAHVRIWALNAGSRTNSTGGALASVSATANASGEHFFWFENDGSGTLSLYVAYHAFGTPIPVKPSSALCTLAYAPSTLTSGIAGFFYRATNSVTNYAIVALRDVKFTEY